MTTRTCMYYTYLVGFESVLKPRDSSHVDNSPKSGLFSLVGAYRQCVTPSLYLYTPFSLLHPVLVVTGEGEGEQVDRRRPRQQPRRRGGYSGRRFRRGPPRKTEVRHIFLVPLISLHSGGGALQHEIVCSRYVHVSVCFRPLCMQYIQTYNYTHYTRQCWVFLASVSDPNAQTGQSFYFVCL